MDGCGSRSSSGGTTPAGGSSKRAERILDLGREPCRRATGAQHASDAQSRSSVARSGAASITVPPDRNPHILQEWTSM
jgi:hypothetical protein